MLSKSASDAGEALDHAKLRERLAVAVRRVCPTWLASQLDDIVQQAWLRVSISLQMREGSATPLPSYIWKAAYTATVDAIRSVRRLREEELEPAVETYPGNGLQDPERRLSGRETAQAIRDCLAGLIPPRRRALGLYLLGHGIRECSRLLDDNYKRTENLVLRGLADLRECLRGKGITA